MVANEMGPTRKSLQQYCSVPVEAVLDMPLTKNAAIARQLLTEADAYNEMQDKEMAYCLYKRFCALIVEVFPRHKEYRGASNRLQMRGCMEMSQKAIESLTLIARELDEGDLKNKEEEDARKHLSDTETVEEQPRETVGRDSATLPPHTSETSMTSELANQSTELAGRDSATSSPKNQKPLTLNEAMEILNVSKEAKEIENTTTTVPCAPHLQTETTVLPPSASDNTMIGDAAVDLRRDRGGMGWMRPVLIPCSTVSAFTDVARPNTELGAEGVETCAILAGNIVTSNKCGGLQMTHLIFPEQVGGPNTCEALGEEALFEYMLNCKLITIGWIHTHPRQNCFLSSIDLHTQCGYQTMLPEAIAIVVAPRDVKGNHVGVFRLHAPYGIKLIQDCKLRGFHIHPEGTPIYDDVNVSWLDKAPLKVVDLRPKGK